MADRTLPRRGGLFVRCEDGPLAGATFEVQTCPKVVRCVRAADGTTDILNETNDAPRLDEQVHWYRLEDGLGGHFCGRGGCWTIVTLRHAPEVRDLRSPDPINPGAQLSLM